MPPFRRPTFAWASATGLPRPCPWTTRWRFSTARSWGWNRTPPPRLEYGFTTTSSALDEAYLKFHQVKDLIRRLAEVETSIYRLAVAIRKTQKRANALQNIVIPGLDQTIRVITEALEEKEREEFVRLKVIKRMQQSP